MFSSSSIAFRMLSESYACPNSFLFPIAGLDSLGWMQLEGKLIQVNFDGSFCSSSNAYHARVVFRDDKGTFLHAFLADGVADSCLTAECYTGHASRLALAMAHSLGLRYLILDGDSLEVISLLSDPIGVAHWATGGLNQDCYSLIKTFYAVVCKHIKHIANSAADWIAKHGLGARLFSSWSSCPPLWLEHDLSFDVSAVGQTLTLPFIYIYIDKQEDFSSRKTRCVELWSTVLNRIAAASSIHHTRSG